MIIRTQVHFSFKIEVESLRTFITYVFYISLALSLNKPTPYPSPQYSFKF